MSDQEARRFTTRSSYFGLMIGEVIDASVVFSNQLTLTKPLTPLSHQPTRTSASPRWAKGEPFRKGQDHLRHDPVKSRAASGPRCLPSLGRQLSARPHALLPKNEGLKGD